MAVTLPGVSQRDADRQRLIALRDLEARLAGGRQAAESPTDIVLEAVVRCGYLDSCVALCVGHGVICAPVFSGDCGRR